LKKDVQGGLPLDKWHPELKDCMLFGITEMHTEKDMEKHISSLKEVSHV